MLKGFAICASMVEGPVEVSSRQKMPTPIDLYMSINASTHESIYSVANLGDAPVIQRDLRICKLSST